MLRITRINVNDRNSNREDRVVLSANLIDGLLQHLRCLMHPVCSVLSLMVMEFGCKRYAYQSIPASPTSPTWRPATATVRGTRSAG